jgi:hypothetical protein
MINPTDIIFVPNNLWNYDLQITSILNATLHTMHFVKKKEQSDVQLSEPDQTLRSTTSSVWGKKGNLLTFQLLLNNFDFLQELIVPLFWIMHLSLHSPDQERHIRDLTQVAGHIWHHFIYPLSTGTMNQRDLDKFVLCLPYFMTQAIQDIFIRLLEGNPLTMDRVFRMKLCASLVFFFTGIRCADTLLKSRLAFFFHSPPQADVPERIKRDESDVVAVTLPTEDPRTLIEIEKRQRPVRTVWGTTNVSPLCSSGLGRPTIPYTREAKLVVQVPKNGEEDWTTALPPLLPPVATRREVLKFETYDPVAESRSLMQRSRKPLVVSDHRQARRQFEENESERAERRKHAIGEKNRMMQHAKECPRTVLADFINKLRRMQLARNREGILEFSDLEPCAIQSPRTTQAEGGWHAEQRRPVVGFYDEKDFETFDDIDEERAYLRGVQEGHPVRMDDLIPFRKK